MSDLKVKLLSPLGIKKLLTLDTRRGLNAPEGLFARCVHLFMAYSLFPARGRLGVVICM